MKTHGFKGLKAWNLALDIVELVYVLSARMPREEPGGLVGQMRAAAIGVATHLGEGHASATMLSYLRHLRQSRATMAELKTLVTITERLGWLGEETAREIINPLMHLEGLSLDIERHVITSLREERLSGFRGRSSPVGP